VEQLPDDVDFKRIPAMFGGALNLHGQLFLALESMNVEQSVHDAVFNAYHNQGNKLETPEKMADLVASNGVDREAFLKAFNSFGVKSRAEQAKKLGMAYQITGVPVMVVYGNYRFDSGSAVCPTLVLQDAD